MRAIAQLTTVLRAQLFLHGFGFLVLCSCVAYVLIVRMPAPATPLWICLVPAALGYVGALWYVMCAATPPTGGVATVIVWSLLFRATLLPTEPVLSDDIYRYVWDGRVQLAGHNPYRHAPAAPELVGLRDVLYNDINHKEIPTIYPPAAQITFALAAALHPGLFAVKLLLTLCEIGIIFVLFALLRRRSADRRRALLYAWHPLAFIEVAGNGHVDALGVFTLFLSLLLLLDRRSWIGALALALAFLSKLLPLLVLPVVWRELGRVGAFVRWFDVRSRLPLVLFGTVSAGAYFLYIDAGRGVTMGLETYVRKWRFNDSLFGVILEIVELFAGAEGELSLIVARWVSLAALAGTVVWVTAHRSDPLNAVFLILTAYLLLSPTVHPWYLLWILPFLPFFPHPAWMLLSWSGFLAYHVLDRYRSAGVWVEELWVGFAEYLPFYLLLLLPALSRRYRPARPGSTETGTPDEASQT